jgi:hypothetical protein
MKFVALIMLVILLVLIIFTAKPVDAPADSNIEQLRYRRLYERQVAAEEKIAVSLDRLARCSCKGE